jgi:hypothetical protein
VSKIVNRVAAGASPAAVDCILLTEKEPKGGRRGACRYTMKR